MTSRSQLGKFSLFLFFLFLGLNGVLSQGRGFIADSAMVVSAHPKASEVGLKILKAGGNAWDAAIAVQFALAVVYPVAGNIGGGGFAVFRSKDGKIGALDFREKAPAKAHRDMYLDDQGNVKGRLSLEGHLAAGVPGSVDGMVHLHQSFGSLSWKELLQPAVDLARMGFLLTPEGAAEINESRELFRKVNTFKMDWCDREWKSGDLLVQPDLASTLERIRDLGRAGFYEGETARLIEEEMQRGDGWITKTDLAQYQSMPREPVTGMFRGYRVISMPPPSSGGIALLQLLQSAEQFPLFRYGFHDWKTIHLMTELEKRVYADRASYLGDPDFVEVPVLLLLDKKYLTDRMAPISFRKSTPSQNIKEGQVDIIESVETTHFSVVDRWGNAVAVTTTLNSYFGNKVMVKGAGFFLNNEMDDFSVKSGVPNQFGLVGSKANEIASGKRMLSSMTPTILDKDGNVFMVLGSPGGSTIITSVFQTILNVVEHGMGMQSAVDAPRLHHQWLPDRILAEGETLSEKTIRKLRKKGHEFEKRGSIGRVDAILRLPDGRLEGGADHRGEDKAMGY